MLAKWMWAFALNFLKGNPVKSFAVQQVLASVAIVAIWFAALLSLSDKQTQQPSHVRLAENSSSKHDKIVHEPRDPKSTGETARHYHRDENGFLNKKVIDFADQTKAEVEYNVFGKPCRVVETDKDGSVAVFELDPMKAQLLSIELRRADGTMQASLKQRAEGVIERVYYSTSGVAACRQLIKPDGGMSAELLGEEGKTVQGRFTIEARPRGSQRGEQQNVKCVLEIFGKEGKLLRQETVTREYNGGEGEDGEPYDYYSETIDVRVFWEDSGALRLEQQWQASQGDSGNLQFAFEYERDGKTKLRAYGPSNEAVGKDRASHRIDTLDASGKVTASQFLNGQSRLIMEKTSNTSGERVNILSKPAPIDALITSRPTYKSVPPEYFDSGMWETRLQQILN